MWSIKDRLVKAGILKENVVDTTPTKQAIKVEPIEEGVLTAEDMIQKEPASTSVPPATAETVAQAMPTAVETAQMPVAEVSSQAETQAKTQAPMVQQDMFEAPVATKEAVSAPIQEKVAEQAPIEPIATATEPATKVREQAVEPMSQEEAPKVGQPVTTKPIKVGTKIAELANKSKTVS